MHLRIRVLVTTVSLAFAFIPAGQTQSKSALNGQITSAAEGPMEGVLVSAKKSDSSITITVASDEHGRYQFPAAKLEPGEYALRIRAAGFDLASPAMAAVTRGNTTT